MPENPYAPSQEIAWREEEPVPKRFRVWAVVAGVATDFASSFVVGIVSSVVLTIVLLAQGTPQEELAETMKQLPFALFGLVAGLGCTILGGFVSGKVAKQSKVRHGLAVGVVSTLLASPFWVPSPLWYTAVCILTVTPAAMLGAYMAKRPVVESSGVPK